MPGSGFPKEKLPDIDADLQAIEEDDSELEPIVEDEEDVTSKPLGYTPVEAKPMRRLEGKVIILTGASAGLGKQMSIRLAQEGAKLAICARSVDKLKVTAKLCEDEGAEVFAEKL